MAEFVREENGAYVYDVGGTQIAMTPQVAAENGMPMPPSAAAEDIPPQFRANREAHQTPVEPVSPFPQITSPVRGPAPTLDGPAAKPEAAGGPVSRGWAADVLLPAPGGEQGRPAPPAPAPEPPAGPQASFFQPQQPQQPTGPQYATKTSTQTQRSKILGVDEDLDLMTDAAERSKDAAQDIAQAEERAATKVAAAQQIGIDATQKTQAAIADRRQRLAVDVDAQMGKIDAAKDEYKKAVAAGERTYFEDKSTGEHVGAAIAAMFGAMGAAFTGGPNYALQIIDRAIQQDAAKKRAKVADTRSIMRGEYSSLDALRSAAGDDITGLMADRELVLEGVKEQIQQYAAEKGGEQAAAVAAQATAQLDQQLAQTRSGLRDRVSTTVQRTQAPVSGVSASEAPGARITNPELWSKLRDNDRQAARDAVAAYTNSLSTAREMQKIREEYGTEVFNTEAKERYKKLEDSLVSDMAILQGSGVLNVGEREVYQEGLGGGLSPGAKDAQRLVGIDPVMNALKGFEQRVQDKARIVMPRKFGIELQGLTPDLQSARAGAPQ